MTPASLFYRVRIQPSSRLKLTARGHSPWTVMYLPRKVSSHTSLGPKAVRGAYRVRSQPAALPVKGSGYFLSCKTGVSNSQPGAKSVYVCLSPSPSTKEYILKGKREEGVGAERGEYAAEMAAPDLLLPVCQPRFRTPCVNVQRVSAITH